MKKNIDMTSGIPRKLLIPFAIPIILSGLIDQFYSLADTAIVGRYLGVYALAATSSTGTISSLLFSFAFGITGGLIVITSQRFGAKDEKGIQDSVAICITICAVIAIVLSIAGCIFAKQLLSFAKVPLELRGDAYKYLMTVFIGSSATIFYVLFSAILRALGDSKTPLIILIVSAILNVILNYIFVAGLHMGVIGAGVATIISKLIACVVCILIATKNMPMLRLTAENFKINFRYMYAHIKIGLPMALQASVFSIGGLITSSFINPLGPTALSSFSVANYAMLLPTHCLTAISSANSTFTGQNLGAGKYNRIKWGVNTVFKILMVCSVVGSIFAISTSGIFVDIIVGDGNVEIEKYALRYVIATSPTLFAQSLIYCFRGALVSMGQTLLPFLYGFVELAARIGTAAIFIPKIGFDGAALSLNSALYTMAILSVITYIIYMRKHYGTAFKTQKESA